MERPRLTAKQAEALRDRIRPMLRFVGKCWSRLDALGFDQKGVIYQAFAKTHSALQELHIRLHYESVRHGVGQPCEERREVSEHPGQGQVPPNLPDV